MNTAEKLRSIAQEAVHYKIKEAKESDYYQNLLESIANAAAEGYVRLLVNCDTRDREKVRNIEQFITPNLVKDGFQVSEIKLKDFNVFGVRVKSDYKGYFIISWKDDLQVFDVSK